jgi:hypothetical protein
MTETLKMPNNDKLKSLLQQVINKLKSKQIVFTAKQEKRINELIIWEKVLFNKPTYVQNNFDVYGELKEELEKILKEA